MIVGTPPNWSKDNAALLRQFLDGGTGQLFLATLAAQRPALSSHETLESVALRSKLVSGYEAALANILSLAEPPKDELAVKEESEAYPDLDDDKKWENAGKPTTP